MKTRLLRHIVPGLLLALVTAGNLQAQINVLWYGVDAAYNAKITTLASTAHTYDPLGNGSLAWNLDFWNAGDTLPTFSNYNVLVVGSSAKAFFSNFNDSRLLGAKTEIEAARGNRTFLSGQDADWHYINGPGAVDNGPRGFLINGVNWAASGTGLGIVALPDGWQGSPNGWMTKVDSFLRDELFGNTLYFQSDSVVIPGSTATFPVNEGLTTAGLSNWGISSHMGFLLNTPNYTSINVDGGGTRSITMLTESQASGGTTGPMVSVGVPDTGSTVLMFMGAFAFLGFLRRQAA